MSGKLTYKQSGVDTKEAAAFVSDISSHVKRTQKQRSLHQAFGLFAAAYDLSSYKEPVIVTGCDGVGTKTEILFELDMVETAGKDLVAMNVNDILTTGGDPLLFLDYLGISNLERERSRITRLVAGMCDYLESCNCILAGGETAEMPGFYPENEYDLAGFCVGLVDEEKILNKQNVQPGDALIGIASSGLHSNGFSLVRKVLGVGNWDLSVFDKLLGSSALETLLTPTKIYVKPILALLEQVQVRSLSNITGGGFFENIPRALPEGLQARIQKDSYPVPQIFRVLQSVGGIEERDMYNTFNMGIGMCAAVPADEAAKAIAVLHEAGEMAYKIGVVEEGKEGVVLW